MKKKGRKQKLIKIDPKLEEVVKKMVEKKKKQDKNYSFSDFINDLLKKEVLSFNEVEEYENDKIEIIEDDEELTKQDKKEFNNKRLYRVMFNKLDLVKKGIFENERQERENVKKLLYEQSIKEINALLTNHEKIKDKVMKAMHEELKMIKQYILQKDWVNLFKVCNIKEREDKYLIHLLKKRGREDIVKQIFFSSF